MPARKLLAYASIYVLWGGSFLAIRELVAPTHGGAPVPPFFAAGFRFTLAGLILLGWSRFAQPARLTACQFYSATLLGFIMFACLYAPLFWAETRVASGLASVISAMIPVWIFAGELFVLRTQRATAVAVSGIALGFAGVVLLSLHGRGAAASSSTLAILGTVAGTVFWSVGTLLSRRLALPQPQKANAGWQMFTGGVMLLALSAAAGDMHRMPSAAVLLSPRVVASMAYLIVAASIIAYTSYVWLIAHESPTRVSSYAYVNPVFALLIGAVLAGERLTLPQLAGAGLVLAGVFATLRGRGAAQRMESVRAAVTD
jgi:drug/metabolite transporter (DMT)-like permease